MLCMVHKPCHREILIGDPGPSSVNSTWWKRIVLQEKKENPTPTCGTCLVKSKSIFLLTLSFVAVWIKRLLRFHRLAGLCSEQRNKHTSHGHNWVSFPFFPSLLTKAIDGFWLLLNLIFLYQPSELCSALFENSWVSTNSASGFGAKVNFVWLVLPPYPPI